MGTPYHIEGPYTFHHVPEFLEIKATPTSESQESKINGRIMQIWETRSVEAYNGRDTEA